MVPRSLRMGGSAAINRDACELVLPAWRQSCSITPWGLCEPFCRKHLTRRPRRTTEQHGGRSDDKSPQAGRQQPRMGIEQRTEAPATHAEADQELYVMRRHSVRNGFDFNDQSPAHENVPANAFDQFDALVRKWNSGLRLERDSRPLQLIAQAALINRFHHARSGHPMRFDGQPDDSLGQFAGKQHSVAPPCCSVVLRALRVKCLTLRSAQPRGPNGKSRTQPSAGADFAPKPTAAPVQPAP